jgi:hypothetical protein
MKGEMDMTDRGVLMTAAARGAKLAEKAMEVPLGVARTVRESVFRATFAGVDGAERFTQSSLKVAREALQRADKLSQDAMRGLESAAASVSGALRGPSETAEEAVPKPAPSVLEEAEPKASAAGM